MDTYNEAHLFVAAIRILQHKQKMPPSLEDICSMIETSVESGHAICRNLEKRGIISVMEDPYTLKLNVADHLAIEKIERRDEEEGSFAKELESFKNKKQESEKKIADIQAQLDKKKKDMLSDIEAKFKKEMDIFKKEQ